MDIENLPMELIDAPIDIIDELKLIKLANEKSKERDEEKEKAIKRYIEEKHLSKDSIISSKEKPYRFSIQKLVREFINYYGLELNYSTDLDGHICLLYLKDKYTNHWYERRSSTGSVFTYSTLADIELIMYQYLTRFNDGTPTPILINTEKSIPTLIREFVYVLWLELKSDALKCMTDEEEHSFEEIHRWLNFNN